jgi:short-subunit dehydrogenase
MTDTATLKTCVITGASSGLGVELALEVAGTLDFTDLVLSARRRERMEELAVRLRERKPGLGIHIVCADLSAPDGVATLFDGLGDLLPTVGMWINNAGFGFRGPFIGQEPADLDRMIDVDVRALMQCTRRILPSMIARGDGRILNISSVAAFSPIPWFAVYAASKAFVLSFSEALAHELAGTGVTVTAFCPGPMPTEFFDIAGKTRWHGPSVLWISPERAARQAITATVAGQAVHIPQKLFVLETFLARLSPRGLISAVSGRIFKD